MRVLTLKPRAAKWLIVREAGATGRSNFGARKGEVIRGRLVRGQGGKFASIEDRMLSGEITPEQTGLDPAQAEAFAAMQKGEALTPAQAEALAAIGVATIGADGAKLTAAGVRAAKALKRGDIAAFKKQIQSAREWKAYTDAKKAAKSGKAKAAKQSPEERAAAREAEKKRQALGMLTDLGYDDKESAALYQYSKESKGIEYDSPFAQRMVDAGLLERNDETREVFASESGRAFLRALKSNDKAGAVEALKRARAAAAEREEKALARRNLIAVESASEESIMAKRGVVMSAPIVAQSVPAAARPAALGAQASQISEDDASLGESAGEYEDVYVWNETSFAAIDARIAAQDGAETVEGLARLMPGLVGNIMMRPEITDKAAALRMLASEFGDRAIAALGDGLNAAAGNMSAGEASAFDAGLIESAALTLTEGADGGPLEVDVVLIKPGPGNPRDRNYYPAEVLRRDSHVFAGSKMYETDHNAAEKSTRTWVSTVREVSRFTEAGEPVARVVVHDPGFAQRLRNLNAAGLLESMACSILANGTARPGRINEQAYNIVESIVSASSVDWVTRAGAGGRAIGLAESHAEDPAAQAGDISDEKAEEIKRKEIKPEGDALQESSAQPVTIREADHAEPEKQAEQDPAQDGAQAAQTTQASEAGETTGGASQPAGAGAPETLSESDVEQIAQAAKAPAAVIARLKARTFASREELAEAIAAERAYLDEVLRGGRPFSFAERAPEDQKRNETPAERAARVARVSDRYLGRA